MTRSGDEPAANAGQPCPKGGNRGRIAALEAAYEGYRLSLETQPLDSTGNNWLWNQGDIMRRFKLRGLAVTLALLTGLLLCSVVLSQGYTPYQISATRGVHGNNGWLTRGTRGYTTVYTGVAPRTDMHIASVYVYRYEISGLTNSVELGWHEGFYGCWYGDHEEPPFYHQPPFNNYWNQFWAIAIQFRLSPFTGGYWMQDICGASQGQTYEYCMYHIRPDGGGRQLYNFYINGGFAAGLDVQFVDGWSMVGCERTSLNLSNSGTFSSLRMHIAGHGWDPWEPDAISQYTGSDPSYAFKVTNKNGTSGPTVVFFYAP
jgi:hypothetical protein